MTNIRNGLVYHCKRTFENVPNEPYKSIFRLIILQNIAGFDGSNCSLGRNQDQHKVCTYSGTHFAGWKLFELRLQECTVFGI